MIGLPPVDLSSIGVGQGSTVNLSSLGLTSDPSLTVKPPTLFFHNDSGCALFISFKIGTMSFNLPAGAWLPVAIAPGESMVIYNCTAIIGSPAISKLFINYFAPGEPIPNITLGNSPVGGTTSVAGGIANSVQQDGSVAGTSLIEATPAGDGASAVSILNSGVAQLGSTLRAGSLTCENTTGDSMCFSGDGIGTNTSNLWTFLDTRSTQTKLFGIHNTAGNGVGLGGEGTLDATVDVNGITLLSGSLIFLLGSISRISKFSGTAASTGTTVNHGLGVVPDIILLSLTGTSSALSMVKYDDTTMTTTTVKITSDSSRTFVGLAIKF